MNDKVNELVEWAAKQLYEGITGIEWGHSGTEDDESWRRLERKYLYYTKQILSHPDLALIDRKKREPAFFTHQMLAIRDASFTVSPEGRTTIDSHAFGEKVIDLVRDKYESEGFIHSVIPLADAIKEVT